MKNAHKFKILTSKWIAAMFSVLLVLSVSFIAVPSNAQTASRAASVAAEAQAKAARIALAQTRAGRDDPRWLRQPGLRSAIYEVGDEAVVRVRAVCGAVSGTDYEFQLSPSHNGPVTINGQAYAASPVTIHSTNVGDKIPYSYRGSSGALVNKFVPDLGNGLKDPAGKPCR